MVGCAIRLSTVCLSIRYFYCSGFSLKLVQDLSEEVPDLLGISSVVQPEIVGNLSDASIAVSYAIVQTSRESNRQVHLFMDNIADSRKCFRVIFHELFHLGLTHSIEKHLAYVAIRNKLLTYLTMLMVYLFQGQT